MKKHFDLILKNGQIYSGGKFHQTDIAIQDEKIAYIGDLSQSTANKIISTTGLHILPGIIDSQVHFREPGLEHKEDLETGSKSALRGGVTAFFEMPNTRPSTTTKDTFEDKIRRALNRCWTDFSFYVGASAENITELKELEKLPGCSGIKVFMGSSTGSLLVDDDFHLEKILKNGTRRVAIHAEDENRLKERKHIATDSQNPVSHPIWRDEESALLATKRILALSKKTFRTVHILHVSTLQEIELLKKHKDLATVEVTPNHLTLSAPDCYERLGTLAQMNPPVRSKEHQEALWRGINDGTVDVIGTDHAPHTLEEKRKPYPESPSGMPGVQTLVPLMLNHVHNKKLSLERMVELLCVNPSKIWGLKERGDIQVGYPATLTIVDTKKETEISHDWLLSKCGWSPFEGMNVTGWPIGVLLNGELAMWEDEIIGSPKGQALSFTK